MSDPGAGDQRPHRATDGLSWRAPAESLPPPHGDETPVAGTASVVTSKERSKTPWLLAAVAGVSALVGGAVSGVIVAALSGDGDEAAPPATSAAGPSVSVELSSAIADAAARARPSVVKIQSTKKVPGGVERDVGSGVIIDNAGHIITNAHVVVGTETLTVILADGSERPAILIGHDAPFTDLAVIQVSPGGLTPVTAGDSSGLAVGETVIAIGNPLAEFNGSVTVGVVSGLNRVRVLEGVRQDDLIQTDAPINSGNSGGALVDLEGRLLGLPTVVLRETPQGVPVEGIAFALPVNRILPIAQRIIEAGGKLSRPDLGLQHFDLVAAAPPRGVRLSVDQGALVTSVADGGPAAAAGIQPGDVVTALEGEAIDEGHYLLNRLMTLSPGQEVRVVLNRAGRIIEVDVRLGTRT